MRAPALAAVIAAAVLAAAGVATAKPNPNRGKTLYKANCKVCHVKGGEAKDLAPLSKTQAQWTRFFKLPTSCVKKAQAKTGGAALTPEQLADMETYLVAHAADSDQPETCGQ